jgi:signal transduction histidine kinase
MIDSVNALTKARQRLGWAALLAPAAALYLTIWGVHKETVALVAVALVASVAIPVIAADLVPVALIYLGLHWLLYALVDTDRVNPILGFFQFDSVTAGHTSLPFTPRSSTVSHQVAVVYNYATNAAAFTQSNAGALTSTGGHWTVLAGVEVVAGVALLLFGVWLIPSTIGLHTRVMRRNGELASRVSRLTETRVDAVDTAAAELRRVERDLHDGTQARLVALGISLRATERLIRSNPDAAIAMVTEARENSARALADLRGLVRGINPPVLVERGLGDAIQALALDTPVPATVDIDLAGRPPAPVESAVYFAVAEALANAVKHAAAQHVHIRIEHRGGMLRGTVTDDGHGGADPANGTGLSGIERRLGSFDGVLAISSPPGGPTIIAVELPCAL